MKTYTISAVNGDCNKSFWINVEAASPSDALAIVQKMLSHPMEFRYHIKQKENE